MQSRAPALPGVLGISLLANAVTGLIAFVLVFGLGVFPLEPRTLVPVAGMVIGNAMKAQVVSAQRTVDAVAERRLELVARLTLEQPSAVAARPTTPSVLRTALTPQIETARAVGLAFLPGAMTGLILAGVDPIDAVLVQAAPDVRHPRRGRDVDGRDHVGGHATAVHVRPSTRAAPQDGRHRLTPRVAFRRSAADTIRVRRSGGRRPRTRGAVPGGTVRARCGRDGL